MMPRFKMLKWLQRPHLKGDDTTEHLTETYWVPEDYELDG